MEWNRCPVWNGISVQVAPEYPTYLLDIKNVADLGKMVGEIIEKYPDAGVTFLDQNQLPGV